MTKIWVTLALSLLSTAFAQQPAPKQGGIVYGIAYLQDGRPAKGIRLEAYPSGPFVFAGILPATKTDEEGNYIFENLQFGRYTVRANDERAGYLPSSKPLHWNDEPVEVEISFEHPIGELIVNLPPKAGFLRIHLTNVASGAAISALEVEVMSSEKPESLVFRESCSANHRILVPPDEHLLLHVNSKGFREWSESVGTGKPIYVSSGDVLTLDVPLEPL